MQICRHCDRAIAATAKDPAIAAGSLGAGAFHERCAAEVWRHQSLDASSRKEESSARRSAVMRARHAEKKDSVGSGVRASNESRSGGPGSPTDPAARAPDRADLPARRRRRHDGEAYRLPAEDES